MKIIRILMLSFITYAVHAEVDLYDKNKSPMPPRPFVKGLSQKLNYEVECKEPCDTSTIEGKIAYRSALYQDLYKIKKMFETAHEANDAKAIIDLEKTYLLASIKYLEMDSHVKAELMRGDRSTHIRLNKALEKCENERQPTAVDNSNRSFIEKVKDVFSFERKGGLAPVEDRTISK